MISPRDNPSNVVPIDADERILRNLSKNDRYGASLPMAGAERRRFIENIVAAADDAETAASPKIRSQKALRFAAAAAILIACGGIAISLALLRVKAATTEASSMLAPKTPKASTAVPRPQKVPSDRAATEGNFLVGPEVVSPSQGIDISLLEGARAEVLRPSAEAVEIHLTKGALWAAVNPEVPHDRLSVITEDGSVEVKGTVFFVSKEPRRSEVRVLRGRVQVTDVEGRRTSSLPAGRKTEMGSFEDRPLDAFEIETGWAQVELAALAPRPALDDTDAPGAHDRRRDRAATTLASEAALLAEIRQLRLNGDWQGAADRYETLIRMHKGSPAARAALISLGELRLEKLNTPGAALSLFDQYLSLGEPTLLREALLDKANALKALGRDTEERDVLREFLRRYPNAVQADTVRLRLEDRETGMP